jgi:tetratricopeptide (TPR) repeat protein
VAANNVVDSLLTELDKVILNRDRYLVVKQNEIKQHKEAVRGLRSTREIYEQNKVIIGDYEAFISDSAKCYIRQNIDIATALRDSMLINEGLLRLANIYSTSGQFVEANDIFNRIDFGSLPSWLQIYYSWGRIKYFDNMARSADENLLRSNYLQQKAMWRDSVVSMLGVDSDMYRKEVAQQKLDEGNFDEALPIMLNVFHNVDADSHEFAMMAMGVANIYRELGRDTECKVHLIEAAITDCKLAVKENEALLALVDLLYAEGDIQHAHRYLQAALDDANFYNSQFKNVLIARIYPTVEQSYLEALRTQQSRLRIVMLILLVVGCLFGFTALFCYKQNLKLGRSRSELEHAKTRLEHANSRLAEANLIKERYVGYFMHQCSLNINKYDDFRKTVNRRLKANQTKELFVMTSEPLEKELEELYTHFDKAFINLYPNFIEEFNSLLQPDYRFRVAADRLNTTLRIFALIRLGITDMTQVANFLHCSVQTVYNYKSKVRKISLLDPTDFEEKVKKIGTLAVTNE